MITMINELLIHPVLWSVIALLFIIVFEVCVFIYHHKHLTDYDRKPTDYKFSWGTALLGWLYIFFQWKYMYRKPIKWYQLAPGAHLFFTTFIVNIPFFILERMCEANGLFNIELLLAVAEVALYGILGAKWKNKWLAVNDDNEANVASREKTATIVGIVLYVGSFLFGLAVGIAEAVA